MTANSRPRDCVAHPDHVMPDLSDWQVEQTGLPRNFWQAFDAYFAEVADADISEVEARAARAETQAAESLGLSRDEMLDEWSIIVNDEGHVEISYEKEEAFCDSDYGWQSHDSMSSLVLRNDLIAEFVSASIVSRDEATEAKHRAEKWALIAGGSKPVWSFLPPTHRQTSRASNVRSSKQGACREAKRNGDEALVAEIEATMAYYDNCSGWPSGDMSPQWSESGQRWLSFDPKTNSFVPIAQALV